MIRKILTTAASRLIIALINLAVVWISARSLGATGMGTISLIILGISINQLFSSLLGGSVLVYLVPRKPLLQLLIPAWIWIALVSSVGSLILGSLSLVPVEYVNDLIWISVLQSYFTVNQNILLGLERVKHFNIMAVSQSIILLFSLAFLFFFNKWLSVDAYVYSLYISFGFVLLISLAFILKHIKWSFSWDLSILKETFRFGGYLQAAGVMQLFNYRLSYYIIEKYFDRATLGVFSIGVQISESVWIVSKSIAMVQYSRIANSSDPVYSRDLTSAFIRITTLLTMAMIAVLLLLPSDFFVLVFRSDFSNLHQVILSLSVGILAVAISLMLSHYFSGSGKPWHNTISSGIGLIFTLILGFTLIPVMGITGAGITASSAYFASMLYQLIVFLKTSGADWHSVQPFNTDFSKLWKLLKQGSETD